MIVSSADATAVPADDAVAYVQAMAGDLAVMCLNAGRPDAALIFLRAVLALQRPQLHPPDANAAPGDAA